MAGLRLSFCKNCILVIGFIFCVSCSIGLNYAAIEFRLPVESWKKSVYTCLENGKKYLLSLERQGDTKEILLEDSSSLFRYSVLKINYSSKPQYQITSALREKFQISDEIVELLKYLFFPETVKCCTYLDSDGFYRDKTKNFGIKSGDNLTLRVYLKNRPILEKVIQNENSFILHLGKAKLICELEYIDT